MKRTLVSWVQFGNHVVIGLGSFGVRLGLCLGIKSEKDLAAFDFSLPPTVRLALLALEFLVITEVTLRAGMTSAFGRETSGGVPP